MSGDRAHAQYPVDVDVLPGSDLPASGSSTGTPDTASCPSGEVARGTRFGLGPLAGATGNFVTAGRTRCGKLLVDGTDVDLATGTGSTLLGAGATPASTDCPAGSVVVGYRAHLKTAGGGGVSGVEVWCAPLLVSGTGQVATGAQSAMPLVGDVGDFVSGPHLCSSGRVVAGLNGRTNNGVLTRFTMRCDILDTVRCGDGTVGPGETCDDGNPFSGDGCSARCREELGFDCTATGCATVCGDGIVSGSEECDDDNTVVGDGCDSSCRVEAGFVCDTPGLGFKPASIAVAAKIRDFRAARPDFEAPTVSLMAAEFWPVKPTAGGPVHTSQRDVDDWFVDVAGENQMTTVGLAFTATATGYELDETPFFPIDGQLLGNEGAAHNYSFTTHVSAPFIYQTGGSVTVTSDDELFVFVDNQLAHVQAGVSPEQTTTIAVDALAAGLGLIAGRAYRLDVLSAERQSPSSALSIETAGVALTGPSQCTINGCFNGLQDGTETDLDCGGTCPGCDAGESCGGNGDCRSGSCQGGTCSAVCGDGRVEGTEACDDGNINLADGCAGCAISAGWSCRQGFVNGSFEDDDPSPFGNALGSPNGWKVDDPDGVGVGEDGDVEIHGSASVFVSPPDGSTAVDLLGSTTTGGVAQTVPTRVGDTYVVRFKLASVGVACGTGARSLEVSAAQAGATAPYTTRTFTTSADASDSASWASGVFEFTANSLNTTIGFSVPTAAADGCGPAIDDLIIDTPSSCNNLCNNSTVDMSNEETDVDCGGAVCVLRCDLGQACLQESDCLPQYTCLGNVCRALDNDRDGRPDEFDVDDDNDGILDVNEPPGDADGDGLINAFDFDSDNDSIPDWYEAQDATDPANPPRAPLGIDSDNDGIDNAFDVNHLGVPLGPLVNDDNDGVPNMIDVDSDNDGIADRDEVGALPPTGLDADLDGVDNRYDPDQGGTLTNSPPDADGDDRPNHLDLDSDGDAISDTNEGQLVLFGGFGYRTPVGADSDGDGVDDGFDPDTNPDFALLTPPRSDADPYPDFIDLDSDGDGIGDFIEHQPEGGEVALAAADANADGWDDAFDDGAAYSVVDTDGDGDVDWRDIDADGDTVPDATEGHDGNSDGVADTVATTADSDSDGLADPYDDGSVGGNAALQNSDLIDNRDWRDDNDDNDQVPTAAETTDADGTGIPDYLEGDRDNDGQPDVTDPDDDNDGLLDALEGTGDTDGDGVPDAFDADSDNDGLLDWLEAQDQTAATPPVAPSGIDNNNNGIDDAFDASAGGQPLSMPVDSDGDLVWDLRDPDSDDDGVLDIVEANGPAPALTDGNENGVDDAFDPSIGGVVVRGPDPDGDGVPAQVDLDSDGDAIRDVLESSGLESDPDGDGRIGAAGDADGDGLRDGVDADSGGAAPRDPDTDGDGVADRLDPDADDDGLRDHREAASHLTPIVLANADIDRDGLDDAIDPDQGGLVVVPLDSDADGLADAADRDSDGDGIADAVEANAPPLVGDADGDGIDDAFAAGSLQGVDTDGDDHEDQLDLDSDADGIVDHVEYSAADVDTDGDGQVDDAVDGDRDGMDDALWATPAVLPDVDGDELWNGRDVDADGDGILDNLEAQDSDSTVFPNFIDTDGDGIVDAFDPDAGGTPLVPVNYDGLDDGPDYLDTDAEDDNVPDLNEGHDGNSNGIPDVTPAGVDVNNDGLDDAFDGTLGGTPAPLPDSDSDDIPNWRDTDDDNDQLPTRDEDSLTPGNPAGTDLDDNGLPDYIDVDSDGDGLGDESERAAGSDPFDPDTDNDGLSDREELELDVPTDPTDADTDDDGVSDGDEVLARGLGADYAGSDPHLVDTDEDDLGDGLELGTTEPIPDGMSDGPVPVPYLGTDVSVGAFVVDADPESTTNPADDDTDDDGLTDGEEDANQDGETVNTIVGTGVAGGFGETDPANIDTDEDGIQDGTELGLDEPRGDDTDLSVFQPDLGPLDKTDPLDSDTDDGGVPDGVEDLNGNGGTERPNPNGPAGNETSPIDGSDDNLDLDTDDDGLSDLDEFVLKSDPFDVDTDNDGFPDGIEVTAGDQLSNWGPTDPTSADTDNDGISDRDEAYGTGPLNGLATDPRKADTDEDGLSDGLEAGVSEPIPPHTTSSQKPVTATGTDVSDLGWTADADPSTTTDPNDDDTDDDGLLDGDEDENKNGRVDNTIGATGSQGSGETDPNNPDTDGDVLSDSEELELGTSGVDADTDDGSVSDGAEVANGLNPLDPSDDTTLADNDGDGLSNDNESLLGTDPDDADTDGDGLSDLAEVFAGNSALYEPVLDTNPVDADTDDDGIPDGIEVEGSAPLRDGVPTDPKNVDTDGDGIADGVEVGVVVAVPGGESDGPSPVNYDGTDTKDWTPDLDPASTTDPNDDDTDDDGLLDGSEDLNGDGEVLNSIGGTESDGEGETDPLDTDTDRDGILDGTEAGVATPEGNGTALAVFVPDLDPTTTTNPVDLDTDNGGLEDGEEDLNSNGRFDADADPAETDPNATDDDDPNGGPNANAGFQGGSSCAGSGSAPWWLMLAGAGGMLAVRRRARRRDA